MSIVLLLYLSYDYIINNYHLVQMGKEKQKTEFQKLKDAYSQWEEFMTKSKIKMRKKMKKDKQEYYDFDYTRGQYYYNYPENHINFAPPEIQKKFMRNLMQKQMQNFSNTIIHQVQDEFPIQEDMKPLQLHDFLKAYKSKLHQRIASLRIRKSFYIRQNQQEKKYIELMQSEIRSLVYRYNKVENIFFKFSKPLSERIEGKVNSLKLKHFDEMHFSEIDKSDFVVYLRMQNVRQRVQYPLDKLMSEVQLRLFQKKSQIKGRCYQQRCKKIKMLQKKHGEMYLQRRTKIEAYFMQSNPKFLQSEENLKKIEDYLRNLNFVSQFLKHRNQNGKIYFNATKTLCELSYVPGSEHQIKNKLFFICNFYFPEDMVQSLYQHKRQHLCYRLNYFAAIMLRSISQSYNFLVEIKEKQLHQCRSTMHRELQTIFTTEVDRIFGLPQHQIVLLVDQGQYTLPQFAASLPHENQTIFQEYFKMNNLIQPTVKSIISLLVCKNQKAIRQIAQDYAKKVVEKAPLKLRHLSLYYRNLHTDEKSHLVSLLNQKLFYGSLRQNILATKIDQILQVGQLNTNMLQTVYTLFLVRSIQIKTELDNVLCAQISLMYALKNRIKLLEYKHNVPFEMSDEFLTRFTESNKNGQPFQFASKSEIVNDQPYPDCQNCDKIVRRNVNGTAKIEVRRMMPDNPLFQGKKVLYKEAIKQSEVILEKIHRTCAYLVERRENYLNEQAFSGLVDRFDLVHQILRSELDFQIKKLIYLQELSQTLNLAIQPNAIFKFASLMISTKNLQVYHCFSDFHCLQQYTHQAQICSKKAQILKNLRVRLTRAEERQAENFKQKIMKHNHINNVPQISSIYYCDELPMEMEGDDVVQQQDDQSYSSMSQSQFMANSSKYKSDLSAISSDYHVKTTFKQILGRSSVNAQLQQQNRREELMGKKKKELINDSVLGGIIIYKNNKSYLHIEKVANVILKLEGFFQKNYQKTDIGIEKEYYAQIVSLISNIDDEYIEDHLLLDQSLIHRTLGDVNRAISKVTQKIKLAPNGIEHYLFMSSQILKNLVSSSTGTQVNDIRGLYTCLNIVQMSQLLYKYEIVAKYERELVNKLLQKMLKNYSSESLPKEGLMLGNQFLIQKYSGIECFKIKQKLTKSSMQSLRYAGNYCKYYKYSLILNFSLLAYYQSMLRYLADLINDYQLLKRECVAIEQFNCYFALNNDIIKVTNIENKVFVRRKYEFLCSYQHKVLPSPLIKQFVQLPKVQFDSFPKFIVLEPQSDKNLIQNAHTFQNFIVDVAELGVEFIVMCRSILSNLKQKHELQTIQKLCKLLPYVHRYIKIATKDNPLLKQTFYEYYQQLSSFQKQNSKTQTNTQKKITLEYCRLSIAGVSRMFSIRTKKYFKETLSKMMHRKYSEFEPHQLNFQKYYHHLELQSYVPPYRWHKDENLKNLLDYRLNFKKMIQLRLWIEAKIVCFGSTLNANQLLQLRIMLQNPQQNFPIFWRDESSQLIKHADLIKMRFEDVDQMSITDQYALRFQTYQTLKSKYKQFLDSLSDLDVKNQGSQILNLLFIGYNNFFKTFSFSTPQFLKNYCFCKPLKNQASKFIQFAVETNPNRYLLNSNAIMNFQLLKTLAWNQFSNQSFREAVCFLDEKCGVMKQILNSNNSKMNDISNELVIHFFHFQRVKQMVDFLKIEHTKETEVQYTLFLKKYNDDLLLGNQKLSSIEKYLSKFVQKIVKEKPEMMHIKDEVMDKIYRHKFHQNRVEDKLCQIATKTLHEEVELFKILLQNYSQKELLRQNRIIKSTLNKVLVPKIIINPYLESPLILQNYFFAASLKLSYIDSFLNKLKNRAILVELTQGGFGYLLKIAELDQCIQSLCKGVITFTQKQFNDRFRTFLQSYDELNEKYKKAKVQNANMKSIINICREERGKQLTSQLYNKLDSYLLTFHTKEKTYNSVFNILKSLEIEISKKISESYLQKIRQLEQQNKQLKEKFVSFRHILNRSAKMSMQESKDLLYNTFKKEVQGILNKPVLRNYVQSGEKKYEEQENEAIQTLMKRLRTQKLFYEIKMSNLQNKIKYKTEQVNKLTEQLNTLQNTLSSEQYKSTFMNEEIKLMHKKNIEIQELKRQIAKKEQEEIINKFKLIKINQNLQGKLHRLEEKKNSEIKQQSSIKKTDQSSFGIQTMSLQSKEKKRFRIRTEQSQQHQSVITNASKTQNEAIWREKWQHSERKYQLLMSKVVQIYQRHTMNKNNQMLVEKLREICEQCLNNKLYKKR